MSDTGRNGIFGSGIPDWMSPTTVTPTSSRLNTATTTVATMAAIR
jgi:hypothetical protein